MKNSNINPKIDSNKNPKKSNIGVIGLAVMGANLARNLASKGFRTSVFNRTYQKTKELLALAEQITTNSEPAKNVENLENQGKLVGFETLEEFVQSLELPRKIILMVKSGKPVDDCIESLKPFLDACDIVIDCGNSNWKDTLRRQTELEIDPQNLEIK